MSDNELDNLFKEAAEGYKVPDDSSAWSDMSARLNEAGRTASPSFWNWKRISSLSFLGVTGIAVLWYSLSGDSTSVESKLSHDEIVSSEVSVDKTNVDNQSTINSLNESNSNESVGSPNLKNTSSHLNQSTNKNETNVIRSNNKKEKQQFLSNESKQNSVLKHNNLAPERIEVDESGEEKAISTRNYSSSNVIQQDNSSEKIKTQSNESESKPEIQNDLAGNMTIGKNNLNGPVHIDTLLVEKVPPKATGDSLVTEQSKFTERPQSPLGPRLSFKLSVSPDFSSIKMFSPDRPGVNYGAMVGYSFFNNRWSVFTGAISSRKIYSSTEIDEPYTNSGGYDYPVNKLEGDCRVIDIPVNVYYSFNQNRSLSFKIGLGVSSYLMLSEDYIYHVDNPYGSDTYSQSVDRKNNEWFKMLNMSVVVQKRLSNHFYIELEPFLKAPMSGVGEGNVSLVSLGTFLSIRYDFNLNFKK